MTMGEHKTLWLMVTLAVWEFQLARVCAVAPPASYYEAWGLGQCLRIQLWAFPGPDKVEQDQPEDLDHALHAQAGQALKAGGYGAIEIGFLHGYGQLRAALAEGRCNLLECDPGVFLWAVAENRSPPYRPVLERSRAGPWASQTGVILVREKSTFQEPAQLAGKTLAVVDRQAALGGCLQRGGLMSAGVDPVYGLRCVDTGSAGDALKRLLTGLGGVAAVAVGANDPALGALAQELGLANAGALGLRVLMQTDPGPGAYLLAHDHVPNEVAEGLGRAFAVFWGVDATGPVDQARGARIFQVIMNELECGAPAGAVEDIGSATGQP